MSQVGSSMSQVGETVSADRPRPRRWGRGRGRDGGDNRGDGGGSRVPHDRGVSRRQSAPRCSPLATASAILPDRVERVNPGAGFFVRTCAEGGGGSQIDDGGGETGFPLQGFRDFGKFPGYEGPNEGVDAGGRFMRQMRHG